MIKKRGNRWWVVHAGRDPLTGKKRQKTGTAASKAEARQLEARLISQMGTGQHGGAAGKTVADLIGSGSSGAPRCARSRPTPLSTTGATPIRSSCRRLAASRSTGWTPPSSTR